jgi:A/G-specific adenine glycosylase
MPDMWELPAAGRVNGNVLFRLRHAITTTDYSVSVVAETGRAGTNGRWVRRQQLGRLPLTGLARKILRRASLL